MVSLRSLCSLWLKFLWRQRTAAIRTQQRLSAGCWTRRRQAAAFPAQAIASSRIETPRGRRLRYSEFRITNYELFPLPQTALVKEIFFAIILLIQ